MTVEDYFQIYNITANNKQRDRFKDTLFGKARRWDSTLEDTVARYNYDEANDVATKETSAKWFFS